MRDTATHTPAGASVMLSFHMELCKNKDEECETVRRELIERLQKYEQTQSKVIL